MYRPNLLLSLLSEMCLLYVNAIMVERVLAQIPDVTNVLFYNRQAGRFPACNIACQTHYGAETERPHKGYRVIAAIAGSAID
jgi:hypothetical protein